MMWPAPMQDDSTKNDKNTPNWYDAWQQQKQADDSAEQEQEQVDEQSLFEEAMQGVTPLQSSNKIHSHPSRKAIKIRSHDERPSIEDVYSDAPVDDCPDQLLYSRDGITPDTLKKLRKGKLQIDAEMDLHGMTVDAARQYLMDFLAECEADGSRCVIIVHGKGFSSPGKKPVIKPMVNRWLRATPTVLAFCSAQPADGGTGAVYVLLKRKK